MELTKVLITWALWTGFFPAFASTAADVWQPAKVPLMTRWGKAVSPANVLPEYPRPQMTRIAWQNLNGLWDYAVAQRGAAAQDVPGQDPRAVPHRVGPVGCPQGLRSYSRLWYRRKFDVPAAWAGRRLLLHFGAVDWEAVVWLNGKHVAEHRGGYDAFTCDLTDALAPAGPQELVVAVLDATGGVQPKGKQATSNLEALGTLAYTAASGIWQTVWIEPVAKASIERISIMPDVDNAEVRLTVAGRGTADGDTIEAVASAGGLEVARVTGHPEAAGPADPPSAAMVARRSVPI